MSVKIAVLDGLKQNTKTVVLNVAVVDTLKYQARSIKMDSKSPSDAHIEISNWLIDTEGTMSYQEIANRVGCPLDWVESVAEELTDAARYGADDEEGIF